MRARSPGNPRLEAPPGFRLVIGETARSAERRKGPWRFSHRRVSLSGGVPVPRRFRKCTYTCCACSSSNNRIDSNVCSCYNWAERLKSLGTQLIFIGKWRYRRLDYRLAQANEPVKDAQRGKVDSLTGTDGCATRRTACNSPVNPGTLPNGIPEIVVIY